MYAILVESLVNDGSRKYKYLRLPMVLAPFEIAVLSMSQEQDVLVLVEQVCS